MNVNMLKCLVELAGGAVDTIDVDVFFSHYPKSITNLNDLRTLSRAGYISILNASDDIHDIGVNQKALDYFK